MFWLKPVSSDCPEISIDPGWISIPGDISMRAIKEPSRAKISACLQAFKNSAVERTARVSHRLGMICSKSGKFPSISCDTSSASRRRKTTCPRPGGKIMLTIWSPSEAIRANSRKALAGITARIDCWTGEERIDLRTERRKPSAAAIVMV